MVGFTVFAFRSSCAMFSFMFATLTSLVVSWVPHTMNISSMVSVLATPSIICSISARVAPDFLRILMGLPLDVLSTRTVPHKQCHWSPNRWRRRRRRRLDACLSLFLLADLVFLGYAHSTRRQAVGSIVRVWRPATRTGTCSRVDAPRVSVAYDMTRRTYNVLIVFTETLRVHKRLAQMTLIHLMVVLAVVMQVFMQYFQLSACLSFAAIRRAFLDLSLTGSQVTSTGGRCTVSSGDPQQFSPELLATGQESLSTVVQAEPVKLVTAKLMLLLLSIVRLPGRVTRWAVKDPNIQLNIKILTIYHIGSA